MKAWLLLTQPAVDDVLYFHFLCTFEYVIFLESFLKSVISYFQTYYVSRGLYGSFIRAGNVNGRYNIQLLSRSVWPSQIVVFKNGKAIDIRKKISNVSKTFARGDEFDFASSRYKFLDKLLEIGITAARSEIFTLSWSVMLILQCWRRSIPDLSISTKIFRQNLSCPNIIFFFFALRNEI